MVLTIGHSTRTIDDAFAVALGLEAPASETVGSARHAASDRAAAAPSS